MHAPTGLVQRLGRQLLVLHRPDGRPLQRLQKGGPELRRHLGGDVRPEVGREVGGQLRAGDVDQAADLIGFGGFGPNWFGLVRVRLVVERRRLEAESKHTKARA